MRGSNSGVQNKEYRNSSVAIKTAPVGTLEIQTSHPQTK